MLQSVQAFSVKLLAGVVLFLAPLEASLNAVFWLVIIDLFFGLIAAKKRGEKIESLKFFHTPLKYAVYFTSIVAVYLAETNLSLGIPATKIVTGIVGATELLSLLEKAQAITGAPVFETVRNALKPPKDTAKAPEEKP